MLLRASARFGAFGVGAVADADEEMVEDVVAAADVEYVATLDAFAGVRVGDAVEADEPREVPSRIWVAASAFEEHLAPAGVVRPHAKTP